MDAFRESIAAFLKNLITPSFWQELFAGHAALPALLLYAGRIGMALCAVFIVVRCARSLFRRTEEELWGHLTMAGGVSYDLRHWENVIGRAKNSDVCVNFPSVSRSHAVLSRSDKGRWQVYPLNTKTGVLINGERHMGCAPVESGDCISVGGVELRFTAVDDAQQAALDRLRTTPGSIVSRAGTLWLVTALQLLTLLQLLPMVTAENALFIFASFGILFSLMWGLYIVYRLCSRTAFEAETLAFFLVTLNFAVTAVYDPAALVTQTAALVLGLFFFLALSVVLRNLPFAVKLRWFLAAGAAALLAFNVLFGQRIFGAKNWIALGPFSFQPSEFVKIAFVLAGAATLDRLFAKRNLLFTVLFSGFCVGCLALMNDFGTALIFFVAFLCIAFLRTGDLPSIVMVSAAAAIACGIILHFKPYIAQRFAAWRHVWEFTQTTGYQQSRTMSAIASGGLFGTGVKPAWLHTLGAANTDLVFGVVGEAFGLLIALCCVAAVVVLVLFTLRQAAAARSSFYTIASCAAMAMLVTQVMLNVLGAVDILPLTGVTFPFLSVGGSSMAACWGLLAFLKAADTRPAASFVLRLPKGRHSPPAGAEPDGAPAESTDPPVKPSPHGGASADPGPARHRGEGFFADRPDIDVEDIFGKEDDAK